ncbi:MBL fold metallo-hydrolase [Vibrio vulnificus]|uniref:Hydrolase n=1 Tax=Vibrio vulnificus TaxID=672 RepID=A0AAW4H8Z1_VIBVL|nr:MBL fold metallo-hydrolase [Vibrio vulnificus]EGQ9937100.1 MBL fold metallo-hydrolase [Vibrio vulnificus]EGR0052518.1 MBL fold metallo-hydrolase [Vibrio vulnificus]EHU5003199.1 MBL fold metallo-hydrolase [Vibrio vulnificus]EID4339449.1 MBL fold metallo-hydrolase [Vibrio vulnificus]EIV8468919.1 MBL fold metallo-hydrolase [Vibrio vulnificus]
MAGQIIQEFHHVASGTISYVVSDVGTKQAIIIDPVADYCLESGRISFETADKLLQYVRENHLHVVAIFETHIHADHLTGSFYLSELLQAPINVAEGAKKVYACWKDELALKELYEFEHFLMDQEHLEFGESDLEVINTPCHSASDVTFKIGEAIFIGDALIPESDCQLWEEKTNVDHLLHSLYSHIQTNGVEVYLGHEEECHGEDRELIDERCGHAVSEELVASAISYNLTARLPT